MKNILKFVEEAFVLARLDNQNVVQASNLKFFVSKMKIVFQDF